MTRLTLVALVVLVAVAVANAKFINQTVWTNGMDAPNYPSHVFYYNHLIHVTRDIGNGNSGQTPTMIRYDSNGNVNRLIRFPLACSQQYCNTIFANVDVQGNKAYLAVITDVGYQSARYQIYTVNLDTLNYASSSVYQYYAPTWYPYTNEAVVFTTEGQNQNEQIGPFNLPTLTQGQYSSLPYFNQLDMGVAMGNSLLLCGEQEQQQNSAYVQLNINTMTVNSKMGINQCPMNIWIRNTSRIAVVKSEETSNNYNTIYFATLPITQSLPSQTPWQTVIRGAQANNVLAGENYAFIAAQSSNNQDLNILYQLDISQGNYNVIDRIDVPTAYYVWNYETSKVMLSLGLDSEYGQLAQILAESGQQNTAAILVTDFQ